jgi:hypothetical protein
MGHRALTDADVEAVAQRVVELLRQEPAATPALVDARTLAQMLGVGAEWVREHAAELGARKLTDGPRPRLRFDVDQARAALAACSAGKRSDAEDPASERDVQRRRRRSAGAGATSAPLLPIRGERAA